MADTDVAQREALAERTVGRAIAGRAAVSVLAAIAMGATFALLSGWASAEPWSDSLRLGVLFAVVSVVRDAVVGLWRLRYRRDAFVHGRGRGAALRFLGLRRTA